jgi:CXXX repeat modification system protein
MKKEVGQVTPEEKDAIQNLFERRNGLNELAKIVTADNELLYEKLVRDLGETGTKFQQWWNDMSNKYQWESSADGHWTIDFNTCKIYLEK